MSLKNISGDQAFIVVSGVDRTTESGSAFIARMSVLTLIHGFLSSGLWGTTSRITQLPRLVINTPNEMTEIKKPETINVSWSTEWLRWDGLPYTTSYPADFFENDSDLRYALLYSKDNGKTWLHMMDNSNATPGSPKESLLRTDWFPNGSESYSWNVYNTEKFPEGTYLIRVEAYRMSVSCHYSYHIQMIYINR